MTTLNYEQRYLVHEFVEDFRDGLMPRRDLVQRVVHIAGGTTAAATLLAAMGVPEAAAQDDGTPAASPAPTPVPPHSLLAVVADDPAIAAGEVLIDSGGVSITAYEARRAASATPAATEAPGGPPLVLVCHENRGLTEHIRDVTRRFAKEGYVTAALDLLSREGGTANVADPSQIPALLTKGDDIFARHVGDFRAAIAHYRTGGGVDPDALGMTGYCFGGGVTWRMATETPELRAAVPFYGPRPPLDAIPNIRAAVLGVYSDDPNDFANEGQAELVAALEAAGVTFQINTYPGTQHAFHNDTGPRHNEAQARIAWQDTLGWFAQHIRG